MRTERMLAYLSAAPGDAAWVGALHRDLERCLSHAGAAGRVFWEAADIARGTGIVGAQQEGPNRARCFLLVVTPEALADRRRTDLWQSFHRLAQHDPGQRLVPVIVEEKPLPPFLDGIRPVVFNPQDADAYRRAAGELVAAVPTHSEAPELPSDIEALPFPGRGLPAELRRSLVDWLTPVMRQPAVVPRGVADSLRLPGSASLNHPSAACAASSAIVLATGKDDPVPAALRLAAALEREGQEGRAPALRALAAHAPGGDNAADRLPAFRTPPSASWRSSRSSACADSNSSPSALDAWDKSTSRRGDST